MAREQFQTAAHRARFRHTHQSNSNDEEDREDRGTSAMRSQKGEPKTGGRQKGTENKATLARERALADLIVDAKDPVSFFSSIMRDGSAPFEKREAAADRLLPYYHPKLASVMPVQPGRRMRSGWRTFGECWKTKENDMANGKPIEITEKQRAMLAQMLRDGTDPIS
jgi:hypothetical protein